MKTEGKESLWQPDRVKNVQLFIEFGSMPKESPIINVYKSGRATL